MACRCMCFPCVEEEKVNVLTQDKASIYLNVEANFLRMLLWPYAYLDDKVVATGVYNLISFNTNHLHITYLLSC